VLGELTGGNAKRAPPCFPVRETWPRLRPWSKPGLPG